MTFRIAFFGLINTFDFKHIGGVDSIIRRIALRLAELDNQVDLVYYGAYEDKNVFIQENIQQKFFRDFEDSLRQLDDGYDHIISIYLKPINRIRFAHFRKERDKHITFHQFYFGWNESRLKREMLFAEARFWPFNGCLFCVSPRIHRYVSRWASRAELFLPPVPESYFCNHSNKLNDGKLRVTYAGRVDASKGTIEAVEVCRQLATRDNIEARISGFAWPHKQETSQLHRKLLADANIIYESVKYKCWTPEVDDNLINLLRRTDILLLPYRKLSSTIDTPLLLLEGMANLCAIVTPPLGDLHQTYGSSYFNLNKNWNIDIVIKLVEKARLYLEFERQRLMQQNTYLRFDTTSIVDRFRKILHEGV